MPSFSKEQNHKKLFTPEGKGNERGKAPCPSLRLEIYTAETDQLYKIKKQKVEDIREAFAKQSKKKSQRHWVDKHTP